MCDHHFPGKVCLPDPAFLAPDGTGVPVISLDANNGDIFVGGPAGGFGHRGRLVITDADANPTFTVDGATGEVSQTGDIVLFDSAGNERIRITGDGAEIIIKNTGGVPVMRIGSHGDVTAGGGGEDGDVLVQDAAGTTVIHLDGASGDATLGGGGQDGDLILKNSGGNQTIHLDGNEGDVIIRREVGGTLRDVIKLDASLAALYLGSAGSDGDIIVRNNAGQDSFQVDGNEGDVIIRRDVGGTLRDVIKLDASLAALYLGSEGSDGDIIVRNNAGQDSFRVDGNEGDVIIRRDVGGTLRDVIKLDASHAALYLGSEGNEGDIIVRNNAGQDSFRVDGNEGDVIIRRDIGGTLRDVMTFDASHAAMYLGSQGNEGDLFVRDSAGNNRIHLDGETGDIELFGADCAEEFEIAGLGEIEPGTVVVIDGGTKLRPCEKPYDRKVAGVISGANGLHPGIVLGKDVAHNDRLPVALSGRVHCRVDAQYASVDVGDLLTTSPTPGCAMKAEDPSKAFGAVIGKALHPLESGQGLIPILVSLQ